jgi:arylsulfatase A
MDELRQLGLTENTLVILTSDNGSRARDEGGSNGPLRGTKGQTWEGGMRVPCIVRWPAAIPPGSVSGEIVSAIDFHPTLAALAGHDPASLAKHDGVNVMPVWKAEAGAKSPREHYFYFKRAELQAVRSGKWKLRHAFDQGKNADPKTLELYDLTADPGESRDLSASHPEVVDRLTRAMHEIRTELGDSRLGIKGNARRLPAVSADPKPLTTFDPDHPYIEPAYLLNEAG